MRKNFIVTRSINFRISDQEAFNQYRQMETEEL